MSQLKLTTGFGQHTVISPSPRSTLQKNPPSLLPHWLSKAHGCL